MVTSTQCSALWMVALTGYLQKVGQVSGPGRHHGCQMEDSALGGFACVAGQSWDFEQVP
jgi:hypothetical protein